MKAISAAVFLALSAALSWGDVEVINHHFGSGATYTVPAGKILLLEAGVFNSAGVGDLQIEIPGASFSFAYNTTAAILSADGVRQPLYLKAGTVIRAPIGERRFIIFGRLVTPDELYASTEPSAEIEVSGGKATVAAKSDSKRPVRFTMEESSDLIHWMKLVASSFSTTKNSVTAEIDTATGGERQFVRAVAKEVPVGTGR